MLARLTVPILLVAALAFAAAFAIGRATREDAPASAAATGLAPASVAEAGDVAGLARAAPLPPLRRPRATPTPSPAPAADTPSAPAPSATAAPAPTTASPPASTPSPAPSGGGGGDGGDTPVGGGGGGG